ncbi:MAG: glycosyltransferase family 9 protein [Fidelibacterota bacterium]
MIVKKAEKAGKKFLFSLLGLLIKRASTLPPSDVHLNEISKIVLIRQDNRLGNLIILTPLIRAIKDFFPRSQLSIVVGERYHELFLKDPYIDDILIFGQRKFLRSPFALISFLSKLGRKRFDMAIDAGNMGSFSFNNGFLTYFTKARYRIGYRRGRSELLLNVPVPPITDVRTEREVFLNLLEYVVQRKFDSSTHLCLSDEEEGEFRRDMEKLGVKDSDFIVGIHPGGRYDKKWGVDNFLNLAKRIIDNFPFKIFIFAGSAERDEIEIFSTLDRSKIHIFFSRPLRKFMGTVNRCNLFVSGDTGPMHMAVALGVPTLEIFLVDNYQRYGYSGNGYNLAVYSKNPSVHDVYRKFVELIEKMDSSLS